MMRLRVLCCGAVLLAGCGNATSARPFGGSYHLITVDGQTLPLPLYSFSATPTIVGGTFVAEPDSLHVTFSLQGVDGKGNPVGDIVPWLEVMAYTRQGDSLVVVPDQAGAGSIVGSDVRLQLPLPPSSIEFCSCTRTFLFAP